MKRFLIVLLLLGLLLQVTGVGLPDQATSSTEEWVSVLYLTDAEHVSGITVMEDATHTRAASHASPASPEDESSALPVIAQINYDIGTAARSPEAESTASLVIALNTVSHETEIPEFGTIVLPVAVILVLFLFFNYRRRHYC